MCQQLKLFENNEGGIEDAVSVVVRKLPKSKSKCCDKVRPFLRYPGSKYNASKFIEPFWANIEFDEYREPFLGGGAVFFKMPKCPYSVLNDLDEDLLNCYRVVQDPVLLAKLKSDVAGVVPSREWFDELKQTNPTDSYSRALRYFLINRTAYSGIMNLPNWGFHPVKSVQPDKWPERLQSAHDKLAENVELTNLHFREVIGRPTNKRVWMFIDPPYFAADQKRAYKKSFQIEDHVELAELLKTTPHMFCLTYDNCPQIKELYSWANIYELEWMYHTANSNVTTRKKGKELIITNYEFTL